MKTPTSRTAEVSAPSKANSTPSACQNSHLAMLSADDQEFLLVLGCVAGRVIAAHLHQRRGVSINTSN